MLVNDGPLDGREGGGGSFLIVITIDISLPNRFVCAYTANVVSVNARIQISQAFTNTGHTNFVAVSHFLILKQLSWIQILAGHEVIKLEQVPVGLRIEMVYIIDIRQTRVNNQVCDCGSTCWLL